MLETLDPTTIVFGALVILGSLALLAVIFPRYGCALMALVAIAGLLFLTDNGGIAIVGAVAVAIVYLFVKFRQAAGNVNVNIENIGSGNNITINR